ncbi:hypothetical protein D3C71_780330 [compost metagenome]
MEVSQHDGALSSRYAEQAHQGLQQRCLAGTVWSNDGRQFGVKRQFRRRSSEAAKVSQRQALDMHANSLQFGMLLQRTPSHVGRPWDTMLGWGSFARSARPVQLAYPVGRGSETRAQRRA